MSFSKEKHSSWIPHQTLEDPLAYCFLVGSEAFFVAWRMFGALWKLIGITGGWELCQALSTIPLSLCLGSIYLTNIT